MDEPVGIRILEAPKRGDWECHLFGGDPDAGWGLVYVPTAANVPNAFWRLMQFLAFGNRWRRRKGDSDAN